MTILAADATGAVVDAHQHFWMYNEREYPWMGSGMDSLRRDHLPQHLTPWLERAGVQGTVAVQARRTLAETEWLLGLAARHTFILGIVGWVDFRAPDLESTLERLSANPHLVGVRELIHDMPDEEYAVSLEHLRGIRALADVDLAYDLLLRPPQLHAAVRLVDRFPEQRFVVDHIAKPEMRARPGHQAGLDSRHTIWLQGIAALAERPNVNCKLSGLVTEADWEHWQPEHLTPFLDVVLDAFGPQRLMLGSDWPVCTCAADYATTVGIVRDWASELSTDEQSAILADTCQRFYGLQDRSNSRPA